MRKLMITLMFAALTGMACGEDWFVNPNTGNNDNSGATAALAEKTIAAAIADASTGDTIELLDGTYDDSTQGAGWRLFINYNNSLTIRKAPTATGTIALSGTDAQYLVYVTGADGTKTTTFKNITFSPGSRRAVYRVVDSEHDLVFDTCIFNEATATPTWVYQEVVDSATPTRTTTLINCTVNAPTGDGFALSGGSLNISGGSINSRIIADQSDADLNIGEVVLDDVDITLSATGTANRVVGLDVTGTIGNLRIKDCDISGELEGAYAISVYDKQCTNTDIIGNTATLTCSSGNYGFLNIGKDTVSPAASRVNTNIIGNIVSVTGAAPGHLFLIGFGCNGALIEGNIGTGGNYGIVHKSIGGTICFNNITGPKPITCYDGSGTHIYNNFVHSTDTSESSAAAGIVLGDQSGGNFITHPKVYRNIIVSDSTYCITDDADTAAPTSYINSNIYWRASGNLSYLGSGARADLTAMKAFWATTGLYRYNDSYSIYRNPASKTGLFIDMDSDGVKEWIGIPQSIGKNTIFGGSSIFGS